MNYGIAQGIITIIVMFTFLGIFIWAYSPRQKQKFKDASQLIFDKKENEGMQENKNNE